MHYTRDTTRLTTGLSAGEWAGLAAVKPDPSSLATWQCTCPFPPGQACAPRPSVCLREPWPSLLVCPLLAEGCPRPPGGSLLGGGLPSLDVHLVRRGAILHLALGGGACGAEKHKSRVVSREDQPRQTHLEARTCVCPPGPTGDGLDLSTVGSHTYVTPRCHLSSLPTSWLFRQSQ